MTVSPDARTPSASVHDLVGSTPPGAARPAQPFGIATAPAAVAELPDTWQHVGLLAGSIVAGLATARDAAVIDLAGRVTALAERHGRVEDRMLVIHGRIDRWNFANRPKRPEPLPSEMSLVRSRTDTHEVTHIEQPLQALTEQKALREAYEAAEAAHEAAVERKRARTREPYLDKLHTRMWWRLERWTVMLAGMKPQTQAGLAAKAAASIVVDKASAGMEWSVELAKAVSADALRIIGAEADARAEQDRQADGGLLALGQAWDVAHKLLDEARLRETDAHDLLADMKPDIPEELFRRETDHRHVRPYGSVHYLTGRRWYGSPDTIRMLREGCPSTLESTRRQEILEGYDRWQAECKEASIACRLDAIADEVQVLGNREFELRSKIVSTPALTPAGIEVKTRVAFSLADSWDEAFVRKIAEGVKEESVPAELVALSIVLDLARMARGKVPAAVPVEGMERAA